MNLFKDFNIKHVFNWICAIEPELWTHYLNGHTSKGKLTRTRKKCYQDLICHNESSRIIEIDNMHLLPLKRRMQLIKKFSKDYQWYYSLWESKYPSGWVHFHVFSQLDTKYSLDIFRSQKMWIVQDNLLNTVLFNIIYNFKIYWRYRGNHWFDKPEMRYLPYDSREYVATLKDDYLPWIEFRANNVFDVRLYGYYVWLTLFWISQIKLDNPFKKQEWKNKIKIWIKEKKNHSDKLWRIHVSNYQHLVDMKNIKHFSMPIFKKNIGKLYFILKINWLNEAKNQLENYIFDIMWIKIRTIAFDYSSWKEIKTKFWYTMRIASMIVFFKEKKSIRRLLSKLDSSLLTTILLGKWCSITSTLKKVSLISK